MDQAVLVDGSNKEALVSVDDLVMRIGMLVVEGMHKDKAIENLMRRLGELEKEMTELRVLKRYKEQYDALSARFSELSAVLKEREKELKEKEHAIQELEEKIKELSRKGRRKKDTTPEG